MCLPAPNTILRVYGGGCLPKPAEERSLMSLQSCRWPSPGGRPRVSWRTFLQEERGVFVARLCLLGHPLRGDRCPPVCPHVHADVAAARAPFPAFCFIGEETGTQRSEVFKAADGVAGWAWGRVLCVYDLCPLWPLGHECDRASRSGGLF